MINNNNNNMIFHQIWTDNSPAAPRKVSTTTDYLIIVSQVHQKFLLHVLIATINFFTNDRFFTFKKKFKI